MAQHRKELTRTELLARYAVANNIPMRTAELRHENTDIEELRDLVEGYENRGPLAHVGVRKSFARSQPTTSLHGQTR